MFLVNVVAAIEQWRLELVEILIVCDFDHVFPNGVLGLPLVREVEFAIDFCLYTILTSNAPYHMALLEIREIKEQL